jgi:hypothetical protein
MVLFWIWKKRLRLLLMGNNLKRKVLKGLIKLRIWSIKIANRTIRGKLKKQAINLPIW